MSDTIRQVVTLLANPTIAISTGDKPIVTQTAKTLLDTPLSPENKEILCEHLELGSTTTDLYKAIIINSMLLELTAETKYSTALKDLLFTYAGDLQETNALYTSLIWQSFNGEQKGGKDLISHCNRDIQKHLFNRSLDFLLHIYQEETKGTPPNFTRSNRVIIITKQMQMPPHAPSVRTLEFAKNLIEDYRKDVMIICSSEVSSAKGGPIIPQAAGFYAPEFLNGNSITYEGHNIPFLLCGQSIYSEKAARQGIQAILEFGPEMILSIGAPSVLGEVFHEHCFSFFYMSGRGLPLTKYHYFHTWEEPTKTEREILSDEGIEKQHLFVSTPGYHKNIQFSNLSRTDFGISNDAFVFAIIGMRLDKEIDAAFLKLMSEISKNKNAHFLFAGVFETFDAVFSSYPQLQIKTSFLGMQPDIMAVYNLANAYLNPIRKGGGSSAAQAMQAGLPILSLPTGDVGFMCKNFPPLKNYPALTKAALSLMTDAKKLKEYQKLAKDGADRISIRDNYLAKIMQEFEKFTTLKEAANLTPEQ